MIQNYCSAYRHGFQTPKNKRGEREESKQPSSLMEKMNDFHNKITGGNETEKVLKNTSISIKSKEDTAIKVNLLLWKSQSGFIKSLMHENIEYREAKKNEVSFSDISFSIIETIDHFVTHSQLKINEDNFIDLLTAALFLDMPILIKKSKCFLVNILNEMDTLDSLPQLIYLWKVCELYRLPNELEVCEKQISKIICHFPEKLDHILNDLKQGEVKLKLFALSSETQVFNQQIVEKILENQPTLRSLDFSFVRKHSEIVNFLIEKFPNLEDLNLTSCSFIEEIIPTLSKKTTLKHLNLRYCSHLTSESCLFLKELKLLESLNLSYCQQLDDSIGFYFESLGYLSYLNLGGNETLTAKIGESLKKLKTSLTQVNLSWCRKISNDIGPFLEQLTFLKSLNLKRCDINDPIGPFLEKLTEIEYLKLCPDKAKLTDAIAPSLAKLDKIKSLCLACCDFTDEFLLHLEKLQDLKKLTIYDSQQLTDKIGESLEKLKKLESLDLQGCSTLTPKICLSLEKLENLKNLFLWTNTFPCIYFSSSQYQSLIKKIKSRHPHYKDNSYKN